MKPIKRIVTTWRRAAFGKYVILLASALHLGWAVLLLINPNTAGSTPLYVITRVFGGRYWSAGVLIVVAVASLIFPFLRSKVSYPALSLLLLPQQVLLFMSARAGLRAVLLEHYADQEPRSWAFILSDQLPVILLSLLYMVVLLGAAFSSRR